MQNNSIDDQNEHQFRRTVSLDPRMSSPERVTTSSTAIHVNPLFENESNDETMDGRKASVRRQVSEPARSRHKIVNNIVSRTESIKSVFMRGTQHFFGINEDNGSNDEVWRQRRLRLLSNYGKLKPKEQSFSLGTRMPTQSTGFDETDGVLQTNTMTGFADNERQFAADLSPEDSSRRPALKVTFKAIAMASKAIKGRISNQNEQKIERQTVAEQTEQLAEPTTRSLTADSIYYASEEPLDQNLEDFFVKPSPPAEDEDEVDHRSRAQMQTKNNWFIERQVSVKEKSFPEKIFDTLLKTDNSNRRQFGLGFIDRLLDRKLKKGLTKEEDKAIHHIDDFRPYFTYWITTVQILVLIISLSVYGFGYFGVGFEHISGLVYVKSLSLQQVDYFEAQNFWGGPRSADLIHLGAKYTPCMRRDDRIYDKIEDQREVERSTGCCIRNDGSGCVQTSNDKCSPLLSTWHKWRHERSNPMSRTSGPVCGQDPQFCEQPASIEPYEWVDDITQWPICRKKAKQKSNVEQHMMCEMIARPCCLGVYGECHITTREFCNFIKGFFHEEATLCSQVSCMQDVCGMIKFYSDDSPDQFYRIWTPIFLHAGLGHILITVLFQYFIMRDIEKLTGVLRIAIIYFLSGIGGYLASAVFLPFRPEVGPAGSLYGVLACLFVEVINMWTVIEHPVRVLSKLIGVATILFLLGLLPWIDNYAHITGFIIGFLLSLALMPYLTIKSQFNRTKKVTQIVICLVSVAVIIITLFVMLYKVPIYDIPFLKHINCIPFTSDWCANQDIHSNRVDIL